MEEAKTITRLAGQRFIMAASRLEERIGADDVGLYKLTRTADGAINMTLGGEVHYPVGLELGKNAGKRDRIADIRLDKTISRVFSQVGERVKVPRVSECIDIENGVVGAGEHMPNKVTANKPGPACDEDVHGVENRTIASYWQLCTEFIGHDKSHTPERGELRDQHDKQSHVPKRKDGIHLRHQHQTL